MEKFKSGFVAVIGKTNVGKSSIINRLVGEKVSAIANKPQTTRTRIKGIVNRPNSQIIFLDTPGLHKSKSKLGNVMIENAIASIPEADIVLYVIDASEYKNIKKANNNLDQNGENKILNNEDSKIVEKIKETNKKTILIINKIDLVNREQIAKLIETYKDEYNFEAIIPISALKKCDVEIILEEIEKNLNYGPAYYSKEDFTDQTLRDLTSETIREKALKLLKDEVPHGIFVEIEKMKRRKTMENEPIFNIEATIYCLKDSHKGIIIGKNGLMLKKIGMYARQDLEKMLETKVNLKIWVKVKEDWVNNDNFVKKFKME